MHFLLIPKYLRDCLVGEISEVVEVGVDGFGRIIKSLETILYKDGMFKYEALPSLSFFGLYARSYCYFASLKYLRKTLF